MEMPMKRVSLLSICVLLAGIGVAAAQSFPSRPIAMIVPFGAGGPTDAVARIIGERMRQSLGQPVLVENVTGAAGSIGVGRVARAQPDGYTVGLGNWPTFVVNGALHTLPYDLQKDFEPVALLPSNPYVIVSRNSLPAKDLRELIAWLKGNPGASGGTAGPGSGQHVSAIYFQNATQTRFQFVPYRAGSSDIMRDLVAGHIDISFDQAISSLPFIRNGQVRAYAVTSKTRLPAAPDIPTVDEAGAPGVYISTWFGLWVPKGTPRDAIVKLSEAAKDALADPAVRQKLTDLGQAIPPAEQQGPDGLGAFHKAEIEKWWPIIKGANIKSE
jgi:tripartite-type tricarboxylate transporter receptor subunit TctC